MKKFLMSLLFCIACNCSKPPAPPVPIVPVEDDERAVKLVVNCDGSVWYGSGYITDHETTITAGHVLDCPNPPEVVLVSPRSFVDLTEYPKLVLEDLDIGAINYGEDVTPVVIGDITVGDRVCYYPGFPERGKKCGYVLEVEPDKAGGVMTTASVVPGNSGALVFNDKGEAVGVVVAYNPLFGLGYITKL